MEPVPGENLRRPTARMARATLVQFLGAVVRDALHHPWRDFVTHLLLAHDIRHRDQLAALQRISAELLRVMPQVLIFLFAHNSSLWIVIWIYPYLLIPFFGGCFKRYEKWMTGYCELSGGVGMEEIGGDFQRRWDCMIQKDPPVCEAGRSDFLGEYFLFKQSQPLHIRELPCIQLIEIYTVRQH